MRARARVRTLMRCGEVALVQAGITVCMFNKGEDTTGTLETRPVVQW